MPEGFLCADAIIRLAQNVTDGIRVNEKIIEKAVTEYLPFMATENLMMEAVRKGGNRQEIHEIIRKCSMKAADRMKNGEECDILNRLAAEDQLGLAEDELREVLSPKRYIGRCPEQVDTYLNKIKPLIEEVSGESAVIDL